MPKDLRRAALGLREEEQGRAKTKHREIYRAESGSEKKCWICVERAVVVYSHWADRKSYYCVTAANGCPFCLRGGKEDRPRMRAYLGAIEPTKYHQVLAEITEMAYKENTFISCEEADLRGVTLFLKRRGPAMDGRVVVRCSRDYLSGAIKAALRPFDVIEALDKFFLMPRLDRVEDSPADQVASERASDLGGESEPEESV
jgi:hypothetical protein